MSLSVGVAASELLWQGNLELGYILAPSDFRPLFENSLPVIFPYHPPSHLQIAACVQLTKLTQAAKLNVKNLLCTLTSLKQTCQEEARARQLAPSQSAGLPKQACRSVTAFTHCLYPMLNSSFEKWCSDRKIKYLFKLTTDVRIAPFFWQGPNTAHLLRTFWVSTTLTTPAVYGDSDSCSKCYELTTRCCDVALWAKVVPIIAGDSSKI